MYMINIKLIIISIVVVIIISSIGVGVYYNNKYKNYINSQQTATITKQQEAVVLNKEYQETLSNKIKGLDNKQVGNKVKLKKQLKDISTKNNKAELYQVEFNNILNEIEVISGNKSSTN